MELTYLNPLHVLHFPYSSRITVTVVIFSMWLLALYTLAKNLPSTWVPEDQYHLIGATVTAALLTLNVAVIYALW